MVEKRRDAWRPTPHQELLIHAAMDEGARGLAAWETWSAEANLDRLDVGSTRILPLLYRNLLALGVSHPAMSGFGKFYRHTWATNQLTIRQMGEVIAEFEKRGVQTLVLKGAALMVRYYKDLGVRPMSDCDVLVPSEKTDEAMEILVELGWDGSKPLHLLSSDYRAPLHGLGFFHPDKKLGFDLHWHVMHLNLAAHYDAPMWDAAVPISFDNVPSRVLCAEHQLIHLLFNGCVNEGSLNIRWLPDALVVLKNEPLLDWQRLVEHCQRLEFVSPAAAMLRYLQESWGVAVPTSALAALERTPVGYRMRQVYECLNTRKEERSGLQTFWLLYSQYLMSQPGTNRFLPFGFIQFLRHRWYLNDLVGTLRYALQRWRGVDAASAKESVQ